MLKGGAQRPGGSGAADWGGLSVHDHIQELFATLGPPPKPPSKAKLPSSLNTQYAIKPSFPKTTILALMMGSVAVPPPPASSLWGQSSGPVRSIFKAPTAAGGSGGPSEPGDPDRDDEGDDGEEGEESEPVEAGGEGSVIIVAC